MNKYENYRGGEVMEMKKRAPKLTFLDFFD
jgi:hypothetical protein